MHLKEILRFCIVYSSSFFGYDGFMRRRKMYNILICDDDRDIVNALRIYLSDPQYDIFEAYSGEEALEVMQYEKIQFILMDIMMPEMDGISVMVKIRENSNVPVILLTAKSEDNDKVMGLTAGADECVKLDGEKASLTPTWICSRPC